MVRVLDLVTASTMHPVPQRGCITLTKFLDLVPLTTL